MLELVFVKKALISVSDKSQLDLLLPELNKHDYSLISTGGTASFIREHGFEVTEVENITNFPEIMNGRVKTLHPKVFAGVLARRDRDSHIEDLEDHDISTIDLVIVNLYPFAQIAADSTKEKLEVIENIDIGGPSMLRAAAKNFDFVTVVSNPADYEALANELNANDSATSLEFREAQAVKAFEHCANYDANIVNYFQGKEISTSTPSKVNLDANVALNLDFKQKLRYGENPHQSAALYTDGSSSTGIANALQLHGKEISFNNLQDLDAAWGIVNEYGKDIPCVSIIKHMNPCGVAIAPTIGQAFAEALSTDTVSAFGGIVAANQEIDLTAANEMTQLFLEAIVAPSFSPEALEILQQKKNLRLLTAKPGQAGEKQIRKISGGYLVQDADDFLFDPDQLKTVTKKQIEDAQWVDLIFAWKVVKHVKSNAIVTAQGGKTLGIGVGQTNRVQAVEDAVKNFDLDTRGAVLASDAFFPFADNIHLAAQNHITAIIQPGGSVRDEEVIKACDEAGIAMVFTGSRHFKH